MNVKLLTEHHLEFLSIKEGCTGSSESTLVKVPLCWKSHVVAQQNYCPQIPVLLMISATYFNGGYATLMYCKFTKINKRQICQV